MKKIRNWQVFFSRWKLGRRYGIKDGKIILVAFYFGFFGIRP